MFARAAVAHVLGSITLVGSEWFYLVQVVGSEKQSHV